MIDIRFLKKYIILFSIVILLFSISILFFKNNKVQNIGFPSENIYYDMSIQSLKKEMGEPIDEYNTKNAKCHIYETKFNGIGGKCTFEFCKNKLINATFISTDDGYDKTVVKEVAGNIRAYYEGQEGFEKDGSVQDGSIYSESFGIKNKDGATGKFVSIELNYVGRITVSAQYLF